MQRAIGMFLLMILASLFAIASQAPGTITGIVVDKNGARVYDATVRVRGVDSQSENQTRTNPEGWFSFKLPPGHYEIEIQASGFEKAAQRSITIGPGQTFDTTIRLEVAEFIDPVKIQTSAPSSIRNFLRVNEQICTGGQPTMEELGQLKAEGVKAVINLRQSSEYNAEEEAAKVKELGLRYFHIPVNGRDLKDEQVEEFLKVMADKENRPVFIHCASANRVGGFWMIRRVLVDGWTPEKAEEEARTIGLRSAHLREFALDYIHRHQKEQQKQ